MTYTLEEVAEILRVSVSTVRNLIKRKELTALRVGFQLRVRKEDLDSYIQRQLT